MRLQSVRQALDNNEYDEAECFVVGKDGVIVPITDYYQIHYITKDDGTKVVHFSASGLTD